MYQSKLNFGSRREVRPSGPTSCDAKVPGLKRPHRTVAPSLSAKMDSMDAASYQSKRPTLARNTGSLHAADISSTDSFRRSGSVQAKRARTQPAKGKLDNHFAFVNSKSASSAAFRSPETDIDGLKGSHLSVEQQHILDLVVRQGKSVFFTGAAGTGKSRLLEAIVVQLQRKYSYSHDDVVAVTATTGLAAANIGGVTWQHRAGVGLCKLPARDHARAIFRSPDKLSKWKATKVWIIDEISMMDKDMLDKLNEIAQIVRGNKKPFGGIQVVLTGDFFQLPPVPDKSPLAASNAPLYCFFAKCWDTLVPVKLTLTKVFRQQSDSELVDLLNSMRVGKLSDSQRQKITSLNRQIDYTDGIQPTELFSYNRSVDVSNQRFMEKLPGKPREFHAIDGGTMEHTAREKLLNSMLYEKCLTLKVGAQVMLRKNMPEVGLVNGSLGIVIAFALDYNSADVQLLNESELRLYNEIIDQNGQKVESMKLDENATQDTHNVAQQETAEEKVKKLAMQTLASEASILPIVSFKGIKGSFATTMVVEKDEKTIEAMETNGRATVLASREQVPLTLAWSMTIHKAQGQTMQRVKVDLRNIFAHGQAYVALSRCVSLATLEVRNFKAELVTADPYVVEFYDQLNQVIS